MAKVLVCVYLVTNGPYVAENVNVCKQIGGHQTSPDFSSDRFCLSQQAEQFFLLVSDGLLDFFPEFRFNLAFCVHSVTCVLLPAFLERGVLESCNGLASRIEEMGLLGWTQKGRQ